MINKDGVATCVKLFKWGNKQVELVFIPAGRRVEPHTHAHMNKELTLLFGKADFHRVDSLSQSERHLTVNFFKHFLRTFTVKYYHTHWTDNVKWPLVFLLWENWNISPKSEVTSFELQKV